MKIAFEKIMQSVGISVRVEENQLHAVTALSGSGPAYLFYLMEAMIETAVDLGLDNDTARLGYVLKQLEALQIYWHFLKMIQKICVSV